MTSKRNFKRPHGPDRNPPPPEPEKRNVSFECSICSCYLDEPTETEMNDARLKRMYADKMKVVSLPCGHLFHEICLQKWFHTQKVTGKNRRCPICADRLTRSNPIITLHPSLSDDGPQCKRCKMLEDQVKNLRNQGQALDDGPQEAVLDGNQDQVDIDIGALNDDDNNDSGNNGFAAGSNSEDGDDNDNDSGRDESDESDDDEDDEEDVSDDFDSEDDDNYMIHHEFQF